MMYELHHKNTQEYDLNNFVQCSRQFGTVMSAVEREAGVSQLRGFNSRSR